ncbi:MAG: YciI family protein [Nakamurella sp.]
MPDEEVGIALLGRDYWLVLWAPVAGTTSADIAGLLGEHIDWLLSLECTGEVLLSGPLLEGPGTGPGSGATVLRAADAEAAAALAAQDPFVRAGLRTYTVQRWRVNEGSVSVTLSLGTGRYEWH